MLGSEQWRFPALWPGVLFFTSMRLLSVRCILHHHECFIKTLLSTQQHAIHFVKICLFVALKKSDLFWQTLSWKVYAGGCWPRMNKLSCLLGPSSTLSQCTPTTTLSMSYGSTWRSRFCRTRCHYWIGPVPGLPAYTYHGACHICSLHYWAPTEPAPDPRLVTRFPWLWQTEWYLRWVSAKVQYLWCVRNQTNILLQRIFIHM